MVTKTKLKKLAKKLSFLEDEKIKIIDDIVDPPEEVILGGAENGNKKAIKEY